MNITYVLANTQGRRQTMEDTHLACVLYKPHHTMLGIFDGHNGSDVAKMCSSVCKRVMNNEMHQTPDINECIRNVFRTLDDIALDMDVGNVGSTALIALFTKERLWFANCGDAMGMIMYSDGSSTMVSVDHKVEHEKERVLSAGGFITHMGGCARINGVLNIARAIGDHALKKMSKALISDPYICSVDPSSNISYIVLASDGLWDVFDHVTLSEEIQQHREHMGLEELGQHIIQKALKLWSTDNITLYLVKCNF